MVALPVNGHLILDAADAAGIQLVLNTLGFRSDFSGNYDESTAAALRDFQRNSALEQTGQVDAETLAALERLRHAWEDKDYLH